MVFHEKTFQVMIGFVPEYNIEQMDESKTSFDWQPTASTVFAPSFTL